VRALLAFSRAIDALNTQMGRVASLLVLLACLVSAGNAVSRYAFSLTSNAWLELQWYMFGALFMLGAAYTLKVNEHVRVDVLYGGLPRRAQLWVDLVGTLLFLLPATIIIGWLSWPVFYNAFVIHEVSFSPGGLVRWPIKLFMPLGFALLTLQGISEVIKRVAALTGHLQLEFKYEAPLQ
jgi:TRAP-type mannitol/chloroaromatic compound transport system permease small subunit